MWLQLQNRKTVVTVNANCDATTMLSIRDDSSPAWPTEKWWYIQCRTTKKKKSRKQHHSDSYLHVAPHQRWTIETTQIILAFDAHDGMTRQHMFTVSLLTTTHSHCCSMSPDHTHNTHLHIPKTLNKTCVPRSALSIHVNQFRLKLLTPKIFVAHMGEEGMRYLFTSPLPHHIEQHPLSCCRKHEPNIKKISSFQTCAPSISKVLFHLSFAQSSWYSCGEVAKTSA